LFGLYEMDNRYFYNQEVVEKGDFLMSVRTYCIHFISICITAALLIHSAAHAATIQLPKTGQTKCFQTTGNYSVNTTTVIDCAGTGQDGEKQKGAAWPASRFTDNSNGTVTDNLTGLVWLKNVNCVDTVGGITKSVGLLSWSDALTWSNALASGKCGLSDSSSAGDWRLPNVIELESLTSMTPTGAALPSGHPFTITFGTNGTYWTSTTALGAISAAWIVNLREGNANLSISSKIAASTANIWPVRDAPPAAGALSISPGNMTFGDILVNATSAPQTITFSNSGAGNSVVSSLTLSGIYKDMFTLNTGDGTAGTCGSTPITILPSASCTITATFTPVSFGSKDIVLQVASNDPGAPTKTIFISGSGILPTFTIGTSVIGGNGSIVCDSPISLDGTSICQISPDPDYFLETFTDNGLNMLDFAGDVYVIPNVSSNHTVSGTFALKPARISGPIPAYHLTLQDAYWSLVSPEDFIELKEGNLISDFVADTDITATIVGGAYGTASTGKTVIKGTVWLVKGKTIMKNISISP